MRGFEIGRVLRGIVALNLWETRVATAKSACRRAARNVIGYIIEDRAGSMRLLMVSGLRKHTLRSYDLQYLSIDRYSKQVDSVLCRARLRHTYYSNGIALLFIRHQCCLPFDRWAFTFRSIIIIVPSIPCLFPPFLSAYGGMKTL
jgi:hypothetical protein